MYQKNAVLVIRRFKKLYLLLFILFGSFITATAQPPVHVKGTIFSGENDSPLSSVSVSVKGTTIGTVTDNEGTYSINANQGDTLEFHFVGFTQKSVVVGTNTDINVTLERTASTLDDVVVVGYGSVKKKDLTGSISVVNVKTLQKLHLMIWLRFYKAKWLV